ncbi:MAG: SWIM zinc finger family protein [Nitrospirota bacterium]
MSRQAKKDFENLSWFDMESWAGSKIVSRGKSYQRSKSVRELAITESGELVAWVEGSTTYATKVSLDEGVLSSICTCPYHSACKHAVAVILEYLDCLENGGDVLNADKNDERLVLIKQGRTAYSDEEDNNDLFDDETESNDKSFTESEKASADTKLNDYLQRQTKNDLIDLITGILVRHPEITEELDYKVRITSSKPSVLVKTVEREIEKASREPGWQNHWNRRGYIPDYSRVRTGLQKLLDENHADEVVRLGEKLFSAGITQVEQSHDEGETADEVAQSMTIVFKALGECLLSDVDKMQRAVDFELSDEYDLCYGLEEFWKRSFSKKDWSSLADRLISRLKDNQYDVHGEDSFSRNYRRDRLTNKIIRALENAGREAEVISLCIKEAEKTHSYERLVKQLRKAGRTTEAEEWIHKGITATRKKWPGIAGFLKKDLLDIRSRQKDWLYVAAICADEFFENPGLKAFEELRKASEKAKVWPHVREAILHFLKTGKNPQDARMDWPLPDTGLEKSVSFREGNQPFTDVLIEIAIHEKRVDDVLKWYDVHKQRRKDWMWDNLEDRVAITIAHNYPDKAVAIWKRIAESYISRVNVAAYAEGAAYLRKAQKIFKHLGRANEWDTYLQRLKEANRKRPRLIEILDALSQKPIIRVTR